MSACFLTPEQLERVASMMAECAIKRAKIMLGIKSPSECSHRGYEGPLDKAFPSDHMVIEEDEK